MSRTFAPFLVIIATALTLLPLSACDRSQPSPVAPGVSAKSLFGDPDQLTLENVAAVIEAIRNWSAENSYRVPDTLGDVNRSGETVQYYLPDRQLLTNPFTGLRT
ncbi:MAG TPA: hypothetical protein VKA63_05600 [Candidatus Krumholzibacteria bacterium]|nr:hypothetical protein [Candidatus Krumholzibacteria bacterium]